MKTEQEFREFYKSELVETLRKLDSVRSRVFLSIIIVIMMVVVLIFAIVNFSKDSIYLILLICFIATVIITIIGRRLVKNYCTQFTEKIEKPILHAIDPSLEYLADSSIDKEEILKSDFFPYHEGHKILGDEFISGFIDGIPMQFSRIEYTVRSGMSREEREEFTVFKGLYCIAEPKNAFPGTVVIEPRINYISFRKKEPVHAKYPERLLCFSVDNEEFNRRFVAFSDNPAGALKVLTPNLLKLITEIELYPTQMVYFSFSENRIAFAITYLMNLFGHARVARSITEYKVAHQYYHAITFPASIVKELDAAAGKQGWISSH